MLSPCRFFARFLLFETFALARLLSRMSTAGCFTRRPKACWLTTPADLSSHRFRFAWACSCLSDSKHNLSPLASTQDSAGHLQPPAESGATLVTINNGNLALCVAICVVSKLGGRCRNLEGDVGTRRAVCRNLEGDVGTRRAVCRNLEGDVGTRRAVCSNHALS